MCKAAATAATKLTTRRAILSILSVQANVLARCCLRRRIEQSFAVGRFLCFGFYFDFLRARFTFPSAVTAATKAA